MEQNSSSDNVSKLSVVTQLLQTKMQGEQLKYEKEIAGEDDDKREEQLDNIETLLEKISSSIDVTSKKSTGNSALVSLVSSFSKALEDAGKENIDSLEKEDRALLSDIIKKITDVQDKTMGKFQESMNDVKKITEQLILRAEKKNDETLKKLAETIKQSATDEVNARSRFNLIGKDDTFKNRLKREIGGFSDLKEGFVQRVAPEGGSLRNMFVSDTKKRQIAEEEANRQNKEIAIRKELTTELLQLIQQGKVGESNNSPDNESSEVIGGIERSNNTNPSALTDVATQSDVQEQRAGLRDTDPAFSRSATTTNAKDNWEKLFKLLEEIRDCTCKCQCENGGQMPDIDLPNRRPRARGRGRFARAVRAIGTGLAVAGGAIAAGAAGAWAWGKERLGFGNSNVSPGTAEPVARPGPATPAIERTRPGTVNTRAPRAIPAPANDPGVRIPTPANENDRFIERQQQRRVVNGPALPPDEPETPQRRTNGNATPTRTSRGLPAAANDVARATPTRRGNIFSRAWGATRAFGSRALGAVTRSPVVSRATQAIGAVTRSPIARGAGRVLGTAGRLAGRLAAPVAIAMSAYDAYKGWNADENATTGQKLRNAGRNVLSGLTFGLVDSTEDKMASGEYNGTQVQGSIQPSQRAQVSPQSPQAMMGPSTPRVGISSQQTLSRTETGQNRDASILESGTSRVSNSPVINVPPPTVIQAPPAQSNQQNMLGATFTTNQKVRTDESSWLRFQEKRAV